VGEGAVFGRLGHFSSPHLTRAFCEDGTPWASMRRVTESAPDFSYEASLMISDQTGGGIWSISWYVLVF
jgi:hypothetical protein